MAHLSKTEIYEIPVENFYQVITDYKSYPDYMEGVDNIRIIEETDDMALVEYSLRIIKSFTYLLRLAHRPPYQVSWALESGDLFKKNEGSWKFKDLGKGKTEVTYTICLEFKLMVPKIILKKVIQNNLPGLFASVSAKAKNL